MEGTRERTRVGARAWDVCGIRNPRIIGEFPTVPELCRRKLQLVGRAGTSRIHRVYNDVMRKLLLLFIVVPALELALLIKLGSWIGAMPTLLLLVATGLLGAFFARQQGLAALRAAQEQMQRGELPAGPMVDGMLILVAAVLLITPGILTDALGFLLLVGGFRNRVKSILLSRFRRGVEERRIRVYASSLGGLGGIGRAPLDSEVFPVEPGGTPRYKIH